MLSSLILSLALLVGPPGTDGFEQLQGFNTVVLNQVNEVFGSERLPSMSGLPVEPGMYVTIGKNRTFIFDDLAATISDNRYVDPDAEAYKATRQKKEGDITGLECRSGCSRTIFDAFYGQWRRLVQEGDAIGLDVPLRVLLAIDGELPARLLVETAYASSESRPIQPPRLYMLVNGGAAGLRARPFAILPPRGLIVDPGQRVLGLRAKFSESGKLVVTAADPRFGRTLEVSTPEELRRILKDIKRRYPAKETLIIDVNASTTVNDVAGVINASQEYFPRIVLTDGRRVRVG